MIPRILPPTAGSSTAAPTEALKLPGLVSALRPLKRGSAQLAEEALLLRRFTYKNKNQHKGCGWWRKIVEVDRVTERVTTELQALLSEFGIDKEKDESGTIDHSAVVTGLLRLPRSMLIVEKSIEVMLGSASILEQLIHSRAFLSFAVVVVSLIARLHTLASVLFDDLGKASTVLVRLVHANSLLKRVEPAHKQLPRDLRRFIDLSPSSLAYDLTLPSSATSSLAPSRAPTPATGSPAPAEEYGAVISRAEMKKSKLGKATPAPTAAASPAPATAPTHAPKKAKRVEREEDVQMVDREKLEQKKQVERLVEVKRPADSTRPKLAAKEEPRELPSLFGDLLDPPKVKKVKQRSGDSEGKEKKRSRLKEKDEEGGKVGGEGEVKRKKKKKVVKGDADEIDSIFG
ncbi:hypothetical protein BCR35DRAFT_298209 [Leucosporidium creatinivorum]|uniref:Nucleolus and neural progenitor protein-like N-terminal domain-containing protein n=1 Tax=Leucosporidium creatinivorum TaxID=106004 RepID=A0A1Y2G454_9BASI|nr:hypothetical protein BCR35DRAFT_298209 [Leucosporidium creatinivorum]